MMNMFMKKRIAAKKNKKKGFTLIEVIVVIVIIAILAAIAVPSLTRYIGTAGNRADMATAHNIQVILQAELSDQFVDGIVVNAASSAGTLYSNVTAIGSSKVTPINILGTPGILEMNGLELPADNILSDISVNTANAKLVGFTLTTGRSIVEYDGRVLTQKPLP